MCGRFVNFRGYYTYTQYFPIDIVEVVPEPNYNIAPTQYVPVIIRKDDKYRLDRFRWGLIPFWAKDKRIGYKMINARAETAATKPSFRHAFRKQRCLILADGFYEWTQIKSEKQPVFITLPDERPFAFAGLWESWQPKGAGENESILSCTILTTQACPALSDMHSRMPVILPPEAYETWLDPDNQDTESLQALLDDHANVDFIYRPVSTQVNSVKNNSVANIAAYG